MSESLKSVIIWAVVAVAPCVGCFVATYPALAKPDDPRPVVTEPYARRVGAYMLGTISELELDGCRYLIVTNHSGTAVSVIHKANCGNTAHGPDVWATR